jgi:hypothetical protein
MRSGERRLIPSGGKAADAARGGVQHSRLTCVHDCSETARRRFCTPVARRTKTVSSARTRPTDPAETVPTAPRPGEEPGGTQMLVVDLWGTLMLLNEARYRTVERAFGVPRDQVNLTTVMLALVAADAIHTRTQKLKPSRRPTVADGAIGLGVLRESIYSVAGPASRDTPLVGTLIALAVLGGLVRPPAVRSFHGMKASSRRMHTMFLGRYGHLIGQRRGDGHAATR